jgi:hypothetical protein
MKLANLSASVDGEHDRLAARLAQDCFQLKKFEHSLESVSPLG